MEKQQVPDAGLYSKINALDGGAVSPVFFLATFMDRKMGIENEDIRIADESEEGFHFIRVQIPVLGVGGVHDRFAAVLESVAERTTGMVKHTVRYFDAIELDGFFFFQAFEFDIGGHGRYGDWKKLIFLLIADTPFERIMASVKIDLVSGNIGRAKEGESGNMVPMRMAQKYMRRAVTISKFVLHEEITQFPQSGPGIQDDILTVGFD